MKTSLYIQKIDYQNAINERKSQFMRTMNNFTQMDIFEIFLITLSSFMWLFKVFILGFIRRNCKNGFLRLSKR